MRPIFRIFSDSKDVTDAVKDRLLDMSMSDEAGPGSTAIPPSSTRNWAALRFRIWISMRNRT